MADCSNLLLNYNQRITLTKTDRKFLRSARKAITTKIRNYFNENDHCPKVEFKAQGSFSMETIVKPLNGEYDIDIGVYLRGYSNWQSDWPSAEAASQWLIKALSGHTSESPVNKKKCVRIIYKPLTANSGVSYHVDLPIYCEYIDLAGDKYTRIGVIGTEQWSQKTDPVGFTNWFIGKCRENTNDKNQLIRLVKYLKAWKDHTKRNYQFPSGMALTVLMAKNYFPHQREDVAFQATLACAWNDLFVGFWPFFGVYELNSPVQPFNNIISKLSERDIIAFKNAFEKLVDDTKTAINEPDITKSEQIWKKHFDSRIIN